MRMVSSLLALLLASNLAFAADYAREKKWADEITPGIVVGDPFYLELPNQRKFLALWTEASNARGAVIVVHGMGVHPDWNLIGALRSQLAEQGYSTLSIQMPVLANEAKGDAYPKTFGEAAARLQAAVDFLRAKNYGKVAIVSHSMGSRMTAHYLAKGEKPVDAWVSIGMPAADGYTKVAVPVLDLYGEKDFPEVVKQAKQRAAALKDKPGSKQVKAPKTDHFFNDQEVALVKYVKTYLDQTL